jgi:hypothetical protein
MLVINESFAGSRQKAIHGGLVNRGFFIPTFALNGPEIALDRLRHQINAGILAADMFLVGELPPKPDMPKLSLIPSTVFRNACISRSKRSPLSRSEKDMARYLVKIC